MQLTDLTTNAEDASDAERPPRTLAELDRLAAPLHARVITREAMETMTRLAYEKGRDVARQEQDRRLSNR